MMYKVWSKAVMSALLVLVGSNAYAAAKALVKDGTKYKFVQIVEVSRYHAWPAPSSDSFGVTITGRYTQAGEPVMLALAQSTKQGAGSYSQIISQCLQLATIAMANSEKWGFSVSVLPKLPSDNPPIPSDPYIVLFDQAVSCGLELK